MDHVEALHLEVTQLIIRHTRQRRDLARALVLADKAMEMAEIERDIQLELALAEADGVLETEGWNEVAAAALVERCGRMQAHCFDLLAESYSPNVEDFEHAAYRQNSRDGRRTRRGIHGLIGEDSDDEDAKNKEKELQRRKNRQAREEEELDVAGALWDLELGDEENARTKGSSGSSTAATATAAGPASRPAKRTIKFAGEGAPGLRRQKGQYFDGLNSKK